MTCSSRVTASVMDKMRRKIWKSLSITSYLGRCLLPAKTDSHRPHSIYLLCLAPRYIPVWAFALRADPRLLLNVPRHPFMSTPLTLETFSPDFYNRHKNLHISIYTTFQYILSKYICQEVLTSAYFCGILLLEYISRRYKMEVWQERGLAIANSNTVKKNRLGGKSRLNRAMELMS